MGPGERGDDQPRDRAALAGESPTGRKVKRSSMRSFILIATVLVMLTPARAQVIDRASFKLEHVPSSVKVGEQFNSVIIANIETGWHIYSLTRIPNGPIPTQI